MRFPIFLASLIPLVSAGPRAVSHLTQRAGKSLILDEPPQQPEPYVIRKGYGESLMVGPQVYHLTVTGNSSAGAFTLMQTNAGASSDLGVLPHIHKEHYETFYCAKGRLQVWAETESVEHQTRLMTPGDFVAVPHNTNHTWQLLDPDTQMTGIIQPGGFERMFYAISEGPYNSSTGAEYVPGLNTTPAATNGDTISALEVYDVYAQLDFVPRRDLVDGAAGGSGNWHNGSNGLVTDTKTPNFVAKGYGPKYLNNIGGGYQLIAPLTSNEQTAGNFSTGTVTLSPILSNMTALSFNLNEGVALQMEEGSLEVMVSGYDVVTLIPGDTVFVPEKTQWSFKATAAFTKLLYVSGGVDGFIKEILEGARDWDYVTYPSTYGM